RSWPFVNPRHRQRGSCDTRASAPRRQRATATRRAARSRGCARVDSAGRAAADRRRGPGTARSSPGRHARATRVATAPTGSPALRRERLRVAVRTLEIVHQGVAAARLEDVRALHQDLFGLDEILAPVAVNAGMDVGVHPDGVARARLDAHAAVDALEGVDLVAHRVLLDRRIGMLAGLDVDALGRTRGGAEEARRAPDRAIGLEREPMRSPVAFRVHLALLWILDRHHRRTLPRETEQVERVERHVADEVPRCHGDAPEDLGEVEALDDAELWRFELHERRD